MFLSRNNKNNVYPCKPQFYCIKVGFKGSKLYRYVFVMEDSAVWSESTFSGWRIFAPLGTCTQNAPSEDSDSIVWMCKLIWIFAPALIIQYVFWRRGSYLWLHYIVQNGIIMTGLLLSHVLHQYRQQTQGFRNSKSYLRDMLFIVSVTSLPLKHLLRHSVIHN